MPIKMTGKRIFVSCVIMRSTLFVWEEEFNNWLAMGQEIPSAHFSEKDFQRFYSRLEAETALLNQWIKEERFNDQSVRVGLELEACLVTDKGQPLAENEAFLETLNDALVCHELARFNIELNTLPEKVTSGAFHRLYEGMKTTWRRCRQQAENMKGDVAAIGVLPTLTPEVFTHVYMSASQRYEALNEQLLKLRQERPIEIDIRGKDHLQLQHKDIMLESSCTSLQVHIQFSPDLAVRYYNVSHILSALMVAVGANAPYVFGKDLWDESRIAMFEQAVSIRSFQDMQGEVVRRVTFGTGYIDHIGEPFVENLQHFPVVLPVDLGDDPAQMAHLKLHNGTIWRWNRSLIQVKEGRPTMRLEHRVMSAGPTLLDVLANTVLYTGLSHYFATQAIAPETQLSFDDAKDNFYQAARLGFESEIMWIDGRRYPMDQLLLSLVPLAAEGLAALGADQEDVAPFLEVIKARCTTKQNGALWQRRFMARHGEDFQALIQRYLEWEKTGKPVHEWEI